MSKTKEIRSHDPAVGDRVRDVVSGFTGTVIERTEHLFRGPTVVIAKLGEQSLQYPVNGAQCAPVMDGAE